MTLLDDVREALHGVTDPCSAAAGTPMNLVEMGLLDGLSLDERGDVVVALRLTSPICMMVGHLNEQVQACCAPVVGDRLVHVRVDDGLNWDPYLITGRAAERRAERRRAVLAQARAGGLA